MPLLWLLLACGLALLGLATLLAARRQRTTAGMPAGRIVYADTGAWRRCERPLFSAHYGLVGKPDYLVEEHGVVTPIEIKPLRQTSRPYPGDTLQLAAYCLLTEEEYGLRPCGGYIKYKTDVWRIEYTDDLRSQLLAKLDEMRRDCSARDVPPSHEEPGRCMHCGLRDHCARCLV